MSTRPLLFFPSPKLLTPPVNKSGFGPSKLHHPDRTRQAERLDARFTELDRVFQNQAIAVQANAEGVAPEAVLVIETRGSEYEFAIACRHIPGMEWLGESDLDDLEPDEDFFQTDNSSKHLGGKLLFSFTNQTAKNQLLGLWNRFKADEKMPSGVAQWRNIFTLCKDIRLWNSMDRLSEYHMQEWWADELANSSDDSELSFEIELWHRGTRFVEADLRSAMARIREQGGRLLGSPVRIDEIRFLACKVQFPKRIVAQWSALKSDNSVDGSALPALSFIRYFRSMGCSVEMGIGDDVVDATRFAGSSLEPFVAVLDGLPLENHLYLRDRMVLDDPDDFSDAYKPNEQRHGTTMCSLVLNGELDKPTPLTRPIYCRPILQPDPQAREHARYDEKIPSELFAEDLVHRAIRRMFDGENGNPPSAPHVKAVNLSVADSGKAFVRSISSWGRLLDWLSWKYKILFIVAGGNQAPVQIPNHTPTTFGKLPPKEKIDLAIKALAGETRERSIYAPADAINALTIGAAHCDASSWNEGASMHIDIMPHDKLMSPASPHGPGFKRGVKPEVLYPGGRQLFQSYGTDFKFTGQMLAPGTKSATPGSNGELDRCGYSRGTSNATALASNAAGRILEMLEQMRQAPENQGIPLSDEHLVPLTKALLVHGANRNEAHSVLNQVLKDSIPAYKGKEYTSRFVGYGLANVDRVLACTQQRATVLGCGVIAKKAKDAETLHEFLLPLPSCLAGKKELRRLTITLAWLTPIHCENQAYRMAKLDFQATKEICGVGTGQNDHHQINRGTVSHNVFEGKKAADFLSSGHLAITVICSDPTQTLEEDIPYGLAVSFEVGETVDLPIYEQVRDKLAVQVQTKARVRTRI